MSVRVHVRQRPEDAPTEGRGSTLPAAVRNAAYALLARPGKATAPADRIGPDDWRWHWSGDVTLLVHRIRPRSGETSVKREHVQLFARIRPEVDARLDELAVTHGTRTKALEAAVMAYPVERGGAKGGERR